MRGAQLTFCAGACVEEEHPFADDNRCCRAGSFGIGPRHAGAEQHNDCAVGLQGSTTLESGRQEAKKENQVAAYLCIRFMVFSRHFAPFGPGARNFAIQLFHDFSGAGANRSCAIREHEFYRCSPVPV